MYKYVLGFMALYLYFYSINLYRWFKKNKNFTYIIRKFKIFMDDVSKLEPIEAYNYEGGRKREKEISDSIVENFLHEIPLINSLLGYNWDSFSFNNSPRKNIDIFNRINDRLIKEYNEFKFRKYRFLNPIEPLQEIFLLPSKILSWFGLTFSDVNSRVISAVTIILGIVSKFYGKDIIDWVLSLFR
ncbi:MULTISPECIES: hypothetical protein [Enterococcus]|uniref:Uncharacterized protein n=1 Tax=Enterococcus faecalis TaxID=1351 RepID=A0ABD7XGA1_ENTFL|nr:hypothetical protein [Enterococcus faecalis]ERT22719.1 hypothetical protein O996_02767 [Enterococcus faecalis BM4654]MCE5423850.1 hypothetical protein [Enterococcus faecalis]WEH23277.1 hypothetical protein P0D81_04435 [Enterococcus faecalis]HCR3677995.1 hypothetical protein [Enterococcus faecalis]HCR3796088.1 hypothetical protein [Enterococcus faecalis]